MKTAAFPTISNAFKPFAWNGDLPFKEVTLWKVVLVSWGDRIVRVLLPGLGEPDRAPVGLRPVFFAFREWP